MTESQCTWHEEIEEIEENGRQTITRLTPRLGERLMTWHDVIIGWQLSAAFREFFIDRLRIQPGAYHWECGPLNRITFHKTFACALITVPRLDDLVASDEFVSQYWAGFPKDVTTCNFANLSHDTGYVVPINRADECPAHYRHLGAFVREAPKKQVDEFFKQTGLEAGRIFYEQPLDQPIWVSSHGEEISTNELSYVCARIDLRPGHYLSLMTG